MQGFASAVFKHKAALRKQSGAAQAAGKNILFACLSMLLYHRGASFTMNTACTKPVQYPTETQLNLYKPVSFLPHLSAFGVWESFRAVSKARRNFEYQKEYAFEKIPARPYAGRPLTHRSRSPFFCPPKGTAAENSMEIVYIRWDFLTDIAGVCSETRSLPFLFFQSG